MKLFESYLKPLREVNIESIARETGVDEYSKKLKLEEHLKLLVYSIVEDCVTLTALCDSLQSGEAEKKGLITISKARLSVVNESRDYRVFVWIFYELLNLITHRYHALPRVCKELCLMGIDATSIKLDLPFAAYGYHSLTGTIERGIKIHLAALLGRFTIPLTAMVTPMNVNDSDEFDDVLTDAGIFVDLQRVILVFDRGYWNLERFRDLTTHGIRFIIPLKSGVKYTTLNIEKEKRWEDMEVEFLSLPGLRLRLVLNEGKDLFYVTNIWDLSPEDIHQCYEQRWDMEILNRDLKSNLKIDHFMGRNLNAILIQIFATLIAYLLIALFRIFHNSLLSPGEIRRLMRYHGHQPLREVRRANPMLCCG